MPTREITREERAKMKLQPLGKKHHVRALIKDMEVCDILSISREDFRWKHRNPSDFTTPLMRKSAKRFAVFKIIGNVGWVVERLADADGPMPRQTL